MKMYQKLSESGSRISLEVWLDSDSGFIPIERIKEIRADMNWFCHCEADLPYKAAKNLMEQFPEVIKIEVSTSKGGEVYLTKGDYNANDNM